MVLNIGAPTAERDRQVRDVLMSAIAASPDAAIARLETLQIDEPDDVDDAVQALRGLGVTVLVTTCDDSTVPGVVEAGLANDMLVLTGCASLPRPAVSTDNDQVIDVGALTTSASTTANVVAQLLEAEIETGNAGLAQDTQDGTAQAEPSEQTQPIAVFSSDLVPDVATECAAIEDELAPAGTTRSSSFTGLVDEPAAVVEELSAALVGVEVVMLCALAPTVGDITSALRESGFDGPIVVPWFADDEQWSPEISNVWIVAPSSRYGDDPVTAVNRLYNEVNEPNSVDVVAADTLSILLYAVEQTGSVRPAQLAATLRDGPVVGLSGPLGLDPTANVSREYRLLEVVDGAVGFSATIDN